MSGRSTQLIEAGLWLKMSGDVEGARRLFEQALRLDPESARARELLGPVPGEPEPVPEELRDVPKGRTDLFTVPLPRLFADDPSEPEDWWSPAAPAPFVPAAASGFAPQEGMLIAPTGPSSTAEWPAPGPEVDLGREHSEFNLSMDWSPLPAIERTPTPLRDVPPPRERTPSGKAERGPPSAGGVASGPAGEAPERREGTPGPARVSGAVPLPASEVPERKERTPGPLSGVPAVPPLTPEVAEHRETPGPREGRAGPLPATEGPERKERTPVPPAPVSTYGSGRMELTPVPRNAWDGPDEVPTQLGVEEGNDALELVAELRPPSGLTPPPAPRDTRAEAVRLLERARELQGLDDHSGARELLLRAQALHPELSGLADALLRSEAKLQTIYESKIGKLGAVPRVRLREDEVIWLNLDHRAGFMLAQIDGTLTFEDLFSVSGMSRLDTARILAQLLEQRVIVS